MKSFVKNLLTILNKKEKWFSKECNREQDFPGPSQDRLPPIFSTYLLFVKQKHKNKNFSLLDFCQVQKSNFFQNENAKTKERVKQGKIMIVQSWSKS